MDTFMHHKTPSIWATLMSALLLLLSHTAGLLFTFRQDCQFLRNTSLLEALQCSGLIIAVHLVMDVTTESL